MTFSTGGTASKADYTGVLPNNQEHIGYSARKKIHLDFLAFAHAEFRTKYTTPKRNKV